MPTLECQFNNQRLDNDYELVSGVAMHAEHGEQFQIPPAVLRKYVAVGQFVELRIDSPRFSVHEETLDKCFCPTCNSEATKPILRHDNPASLVHIPRQDIPARGWGEDFWLQVTGRDEKFLTGKVDNPLYEARLHGLNAGDEIVFHEDHILSIHDIHRQELVFGMDDADLKQFAQWLGSQKK